MEPLPSFWPHRGIALGAFVWFGKRAPPQDVLCSPSTPERQSLFESHRQRRWLTCWSYINSSDTVGLTPQIYKGNHDEPCLESKGAAYHSIVQSYIYEVLACHARSHRI